MQVSYWEPSYFDVLMVTCDHRLRGNFFSATKGELCIILILQGRKLLRALSDSIPGGDAMISR